MSTVNLLPTGNSSPWPAFGGDPVTTPTNTGHAMTITDADNGDTDEIKTCLWGPFPALPVGAISAKLKASWAYENAQNDAPDSENLFQLTYNPTGSSTSGLVGLHSVSNVSGSSSGDVEANISLSQNMANLHVMNIIRSVQITPDFTSRIDVQISNIRVEVTLRDSSVMSGM